MKTLEEFIKEIDASKELQAELKGLKDKEAVAAFLQKHGCVAAVDELAAYIKAQTQGEIGDDAAAKVAGGVPFYDLHK